VRSVDGKLTDARERLFQTRHHRIEDLGQTIQFVPVATARKLPSQGFRMDALHGGRKRIDWRQSPAHENPPTNKCHDERRQPTEKEYLSDLIQRGVTVLGQRLRHDRVLDDELIVSPSEYEQEPRKQDARIPERQLGAQSHGCSLIT
jgi:hypothetical protein